MPIFTQKHYKAIAALFAANSEAVHYQDWRDRIWMSAFADMLEEDNSAFKRFTFIEACRPKGGGKSEN